jgi:hypothetical protein
VRDSAMTKALEDAFREAEKLPEAEQDQLAAAIRAEIEAETAWDAELANSSDALARLEASLAPPRRNGGDTVKALRRLHKRLAGLTLLTDAFLNRAKDEGRT